MKKFLTTVISLLLTLTAIFSISSCVDSEDQITSAVTSSVEAPQSGESSLENDTKKDIPAEGLWNK